MKSSFEVRINMIHLPESRTLQAAEVGFAPAILTEDDSESAWATALAVRSICAAVERSDRPNGTAGLPLSTAAALTPLWARDASQQAGVLAALAAYAIDLSLHHALDRQVAGRPLVDYQLTAPRLAALTIAEQVLAAQLDVLCIPTTPAAQAIALREIRRCALLVAELLVDHFGGAGFVTAGEAPLCALLAEGAHALSDEIGKGYA